MSRSSLDSLIALLQRPSTYSLADALGQVRVEKHPSLPCHKDAALLIPKNEGARLEFWIDEGEVWGFSEVLNSTSKIYLSEKAFESLKTADIK